jgi:anti-sigma B factor antagonist
MATEVRDGPLSLRTELFGEMAVIHASGELDLSTVPSLASVIAELEDNRGVREIVLDLEHLEFIDSTGIGELVRASQRINAGRAAFRVRKAAPAVRRVIDLTGVDGQLLDGNGGG